MTGDDWMSDRDRARQNLKESKRHKTGLKAAKALDTAIAALREYLNACNDCRNGSGDEKRGISDGRHILMESMAEYSSYLNSVHDKK
jgi:hypothetical protein